MILKAYKYRIFPKDDQKEFIEQHFGCTRWLYNYALDKKMKYYNKYKKSLSRFSIQKELPKLKNSKKTKWLSKVYSQSLQSTLEHLERAYIRFFKEKKGFPKFKAKHDIRQSFQIPQGTELDFKKQELYLPKFKEGISAIFHREFRGKIKTTTISKKNNKYYASILVEIKGKFPKKKKVKLSTAIGIDLGIKYFATISNGEKINNPKYLKQSLQRLKVNQQQLSRKKKGSKNREEARQQLANIHEKVSNQRSDFLHKLSHRLTHENQVQTIVMEDLNVAGMIKNHCLAQSISDVGWSTFVNQMKYKCEWYGKNFIQIGRFEPSSKTCDKCGLINDSLTLADREWTCSCGATHDRDILASQNIKRFGIINYRRQGTGVDTKQSLVERSTIVGAMK